MTFMGTEAAVKAAFAINPKLNKGKRSIDHALALGCPLRQ